jgi:diguanylate cyclase (GGDEF)-like protein
MQFSKCTTDRDKHDMHTALVVDDSPIELLMTKTLLERLGFAPLTATNGKDALNLVREHSPHIVICDISMPGMSGIELLEATRHFVQPPIFIMATGMDDAEHAVLSLQQGAYGYLTKPLKEEPLRKALQDATNRRQKELAARQEHERLTKTDPLTGLLNKDEFLNNLAEYASSLRKDDHPLAIFFINLDGLRYVNNTYGQHEGDIALQHVAVILKKSVRPTDIVARYGGDVFAIALIGTDPDFMDAKAQAISSNVEQAKVMLGNREHSLTITIGVALGYASAEVESLVNNADLALMLAKEKGRNQIYLYREADETHRREFGTLFNNLETLKQALQERRFNMHYQPIVHLDSGEPHHYEALIRLRDEAGNVLPPDVFIKVAEKFGLATKIDCMVITACIQKLAELAHAGNPAGLAINLSGNSVGNDELLALIKHELATTGVDPTRIIFEITETAAFRNLDLVQKFMREAKQLGCRFALDEFGVGFSSFYYIKQLDIDYLKIDGSFIRNLRDSANDRVFVQAMVEISRVYGMKVVAEWVENAEIMSLLKDIGVDYGQGYHFGRPTPECEIQLPTTL